jgi:hypothetical protein
MKIRRAVVKLAVDLDLFARGVLAAASYDVVYSRQWAADLPESVQPEFGAFNLLQEGGQVSPTFPMNRQVFMALRSALMTSTQESCGVISG